MDFHCPVPIRLAIRVLTWLGQSFADTAGSYLGMEAIITFGDSLAISLISSGTLLWSYSNCSCAVLPSLFLGSTGPGAGALKVLTGGGGATSSVTAPGGGGGNTSATGARGGDCGCATSTTSLRNFSANFMFTTKASLPKASLPEGSEILYI